MATVLLFSDAVTSAYKDTSKALAQIMKQSFFHGANRFGTNFIA